MSNADPWESDGLRERDADDREDEARRYYEPPPRSGVVTTAGILTMILGVLTILAGLCTMLGLFMGATFDGPGRNREFHVVMIVGILVCFLVLLWGGAAVGGGVGILNRRPWGRVLTLILAAVFGILSLITTGLAFIFVFAADIPERGPKIIMFLFYLLVGLVGVLYFLWTYMVLLRSTYAVEFQQNPYRLPPKEGPR